MAVPPETRIWHVFNRLIEPARHPLFMKDRSHRLRLLQETRDRIPHLLLPGAQLAPQALDLRGMRRIISEIMELVRVGDHVVELGTPFARDVVFQQLPAPLAHHALAVLVAADDALAAARRPIPQYRRRSLGLQRPGGVLAPIQTGDRHEPAALPLVKIRDPRARPEPSARKAIRVVSTFTADGRFLRIGGRARRIARKPPSMPGCEHFSGEIFTR